MAKGAPLGFESEVWAVLDALRDSMGAAEYTHVSSGLIFIKHISDAIEAKPIVEEVIA